MKEITFEDLIPNTIKAETFLSDKDRNISVTIRKKSRLKRSLQQIFLHGSIATALTIAVAGVPLLNIPMCVIGTSWVFVVVVCNIIDELRR